MASLRESIESKLSGFIADELLEEGDSEGDPLVSDALDSLGLEQVIEYIGEEFGDSIGSEEMVRRNFKSIPVLAAFVEAKLAESKS